MIKPNFQIGDKVAYVSDNGKIENGIVKGFALNGGIFVVYNCAGDWENYKNYTAANTNGADLVHKWINKKQ